ncbi:isopeptide-forming domain-containing fimbrial protein [Thiohalomonas denitrificans]|uniref:isopeptide-forming domain-containing fimbrial protein n=1 Tax=Thiohalomonas denitrificans TaxID=415747 RepID=UPI0026F11B27|nr:isopeptide-forming domain-containing fimbrial protein [Thiohalomonas denitrificans]
MSGSIRGGKGIGLLLLCGLLLGAAPSVQAGGDFCSDYPNGVVDGSLPGTYPLPSAFGIDRDCTFINFPLGNPLAPNGLEPTINFYTPDKNNVYLIVFDTVYFNGNLACSNIPHKLWSVNSAGFKSSCQDIMIPAEMIDKQSPAAKATIGVPFTYTLTMPSMNYPDGDPSTNTLGNVILTDDLTAAGTTYVGPDGIAQSTGAELTYLSHTAYIKGGAALTEGTDYTFSNGGDDKHLSFDFDQIPAGRQIMVDLTVVLDDITPTNDAGNTFINTAKWTFSRSIDLDENGLIEDGTADLDGDGIYENEFFEPLPGEPGVAALMTIAEPDLVVSKSSSTAAMNLGTIADYTVSVLNSGGSTAWESTIVDTLPVGMCDYFTTDGTVEVALGIYDAAGSTLLRSLTETTDYTLSWVGDPTCTLTLDLVSAKAAIAHNELLKITYPGQLDGDVVDQSTHTNIAVAQQWYNDDSSNTDRKLYGPYTSTDGSETYADTETITATLSGYFLKKIVTNDTTGESPALSASPGDILRYTLQLENFNVPSLLDIDITDDLGVLNLADYIVPGSLSNVTHSFPVGATVNADPNGGTHGASLITISDFDLAEDQSYQIEFEVTVGAAANGFDIENQADISGVEDSEVNTTNCTDITDPSTCTVRLQGVSDDPFVSGPIALGTGGDSTKVLVASGGALQKVNDQPTATIGEQFTYTIKVPAIPVGVPLSDVEITDNLTATGADLKFVHAEVTAASSWQGVVINTGTDTNLVLENNVTGIDIPADGFAEIKVTVELSNTDNNNAGDTFQNHASYSYDRTNGGGLRITPASDPATDTTALMTIVEPDLAVGKTVTFASPAGKDPLTEPATVGDVLEYVVAVDNNSADATAYDTRLVDTLPAELALYSGFTPTVTINGSPMSTSPIGAPDGPLIWGDDGSLDIPPDGQLVLTYQVTVEAATGGNISNQVYVDWVSWDGTSIDGPRTGDGCPVLTSNPPNDYCAGPASATVGTQDSTALSKLVSSDTYAEDPPSAGNPQVRVGDTVTYDLVLELQEYMTQSVKVFDTLPAGMEFVSYTIEPGSTTFNYTLDTTTDPSAGDTGPLTWDFGDIENVPSGDNTPVDPLIIRYVARVVDDPAIGVTPTTDTLLNDARVEYTGFDPANTALDAEAPVDVLQPQISSITKSGTVSDPTATGSGTNADPYVVDIVNDTMAFQLQACNDGDAPAYGVELTDDLAWKLDETDLTTTAPVVTVGPPAAPTPLNAGSDYTLTVPARDGVMVVTLADTVPVAANECVTVNYTLGFHTDIAPNSTWWNSATVVEYWSREALDPTNDREYAAITPVPASSVYMTNTFTPVAPAKTVASPLSGEVTIGDSVSYTITVPGTPVNAELSDVEVSDTLNAALLYDSASVEVNGVATAIAPVQSGQLLTWTIPSIPAGQQAEITLNAHVANSVGVDAGDPLPNSASYTYDVGGVATPGGSSDPATATLLITEPTVTMSKSVANQTNPGNPPVAGDVLTYTLQLDASGGAALDNFSDAFDISIIDDLSLGLAYKTGSATLNAAALADPVNVTAGDGSTTEQQLRWSLADGNDIDILEGNSVTITYDVLVLNDVVAGQILENSAVAQWTGLDGVNANERDGSDGAGVEPNDYETALQNESITVADNTAFTKSVVADSDTATPVGTLRIGDTVNYRLDISLQEGTTTGVSVQDTLDAGLEFDSIVSINGDAAADYDPPASGAGSNFSYNTITAGLLPSAGAIGSLNFPIGDVTNDPLGDATTDTLTIVYRARVATGVLTQSPSTTLNNSAVLTYNTTSTLNASASVTVQQPVMSTVTKLGNGTANTDLSPLAVNVATDTVQFTLESCNTTGLAPAYNVQLTDELASQLNEGSIVGPTVTINGAPATDGVNYTYTPPAGRGGSLVIDLIDPVNPNECVTAVYDIGFYTDFGPNELWSNSVTVDEYWSLDGDSGEPYAGSGPASFWMTNTTTIIPPLKEMTVPASGEATIGESVVYQVTIPASATNASLYDVIVSDTLAAELEFVGVSEVSGNGFTLTDNSVGNDLSFSIIQIPAGQVAVLEVTARVANNVDADAGDNFSNTASYTYATSLGGEPNTGGGSTTATSLLITEPTVTMSKGVANQSNPGNQPVAGDVLRYTLQLDASGGANFSDAFDISILDDLSLGLVYQSGTAKLNAAALADPVNVTAGDGVTTAQQLRWSLADGNDIDLPEGSSATITYDVLVLNDVVAGQELTNIAVAQWTGLDGADANERDGSDGFGVEPNDYETAVESTPITVADNTAFAKSVVADSDTATAVGTLRIGDTVDYQLDISLQEGTTTGVSVSDTLDAGLEFDSIVSINGDTVADYDPPASGAGSNFSYNTIPVGSLPSAGTTGPLSFPIGDVTNDPLGDATTDTLTIVYRARVATGVLAQSPSTTLNNSAVLTYNTTSTLNTSASVTAQQPVMSTVTKLGNGAANTDASPLAVNVASDTVQFRLESCNTTGLAPAYNVQLTDLLATQLDETSIVGPTVTINGAPATDGVNYDYAPPAVRGGSLVIDLIDAVNPGQCVTAVYDIGFYTDFGPNELWSNSITLDEYWSLPMQSGQVYGLVGPAEFWMTNQATIDPPSKVLTSASEATIGEEVTYEIRVPANPANAALYDLVVSDPLHGSLEYLGATEISGNALSLTDNTDATVTPTKVNLVIDQIPAGQQAVIEITARVANNAAANAGTSFNNSVSYTYAITDGGAANPGGSYTTTDPLTIVEPELAITKQVANVTNPGAAPNPGDILRYSVSFTAGGGEAGDDFSDAFDLLIEDSLSLGLAYQNGTASVDGGNTITDPGTNGGDGVSTAQTLTWSLADATADIDVVEGTAVTVAYDVLVLDGVRAGQELTNSATVQWTGLDGDSTLERDGTGTPEVNDYFSGPATTTLMTEFAVSFVKSVVNATTGEDPGANAQPGDTLRYSLVITNESIAPLNNASVVDELAAHFAPGSLQVLSVSDANADTTNTSATGGVNGTGIIDIRNLTLAPQGNDGDTLTILFEAALAPVIDSGTTVLNQAQLTGDGLASAASNETSTLISSAPAFEVWKSSLDISDDPSELRAGDTLRYTLTVKNVGTEDAINAVLHDQLPTNTTYVSDSTTLNGAPVADQSPGVLPLQDGIAIHAPEDATPGVMRADASSTSSNIATITFDVVIDADLFSGTVIANQGFVTVEGTGSGAVPQKPSDDPDTEILDDPTRDVVGNVPLVDAHKSVEIQVDNGSPGIVDPGDVLRYSIVVTNMGSAPASEVVLVDAVPVNTRYVPDSVVLNGLPVGQPDGGISPLASGIAVSSSDLTPPLPAAGEGILSVGGSAIVTFDVQVNAGVASGTIISNQGVVQSNEQLDEPTDADGLDSNGDQPTEVVVGEAQQLSISKEVFVVGGGVAVPGATLEYVVRATNIGGVAATDVVITDDLDTPVSGQLTYVPGSGTLDGLATGVTFAAPLLTADYSANYGSLDPGASAVLRFRAQIAPALAVGETITNIAEVFWNASTQTATSSVSIDLGGTPGAVSLTGEVWHDANFNTVADGNESLLADWSVDVYRNDRLLGSVVTDGGGTYSIQGLAAADDSSAYELRFRAPGAGADTALLGEAHSSYTNGLQRITDVTASAGTSVRNLNLPITPNGVVYDSVVRTPIAGAAVAMLRAGAELPESCFDDPSQQGQLTSRQGFYKFDINFSDPACLAGGDYTLRVTPPASGYTDWPSQIIPPVSDEGTPAFSVPGCLGGSDDAISATANHCEVQTSEFAPAGNVPARSAGTTHHVHLTLDDNQLPGESQIFNNHIPIDPELDTAIAITKTSSRVNVSRGEHVAYTITIRNTLGTTLQDLSIVDSFPAGFKYVEDSGRIDGKPVEPEANGLQLSWTNLELGAESQHTIQMLFIVGSGVSEGEYVNRAQVINSFSRENVSGEASATVRVVPDPTFDCTDITGKVFDDTNLDGAQDGNEKGLQGVRLVTARGLIAKTDEYGRFHITCAVIPNESRGSNFILKLDDRSLPTGFRVTTENPRVQRATRGKMMRFNFGATAHRVVRLDVADGVFEPDSTEMRLQWKPRMELLLEELRKSPSVVRIAYLADVEQPSLVKRRLRALRKSITGKWEELNCCYPLTVETETFWRRGVPPER